MSNSIACLKLILESIRDLSGGRGGVGILNLGSEIR